MTTLAERIVALRTERGISQRKLADSAKLSRSYLCDIERGRGENPTWAVLGRLAAALGVNPMELQAGPTPDERSADIRARPRATSARCSPRPTGWCVSWRRWGCRDGSSG